MTKPAPLSPEFRYFEQQAAAVDRMKAAEAIEHRHQTVIAELTRRFMLLRQQLENVEKQIRDRKQRK